MYWVLLILSLQGEVTMVQGYPTETLCMERLEIVKEFGMTGTCELGGGM